MRLRLHWMGYTSLAFGLFAATAPGHAQSPRPWVDPPPEAGAAPSRPHPAPAANESKPATPQPAGASAIAKPDVSGKEQARQTKEASSPSASTNTSQSVKTPPRKAVVERRERRQNRSATASASRPRQTIERREFAGPALQGTRTERVQRGPNAGLQVMTLRTIEFPDGRRVQILTSPRPEAMSRLTEAPY